MNVSWAMREWPAVAVMIALATFATNLGPVTAAETLRFRDYPAARTHHGPAAPVNFAGNFVLEIWGCGTTCLMGAAINVATGKVVQIPFSICCATSVDSKFNSIEFRPDSRLISFSGLRNEEEPMGAHHYDFDGRDFHFLMTVPDDGTFRTAAMPSPSTGDSPTQPPNLDAPIGEPAFKLLPEWCQMGDCFTNTIEEISPVAFAEHGVLFKITSQEWEARSTDRAKRHFNQTASLYVFCSKQRPAVLESDQERFRATFLAPDREDNYGHANEIAYWFYFAVCHGKLGSAGQLSKLARQLGYHVEPLDAQPLLKRPEDIVTYDPRQTP